MDIFALDLMKLYDNEYSDIDTLFGQLETIEPPVDMVDRIMSAVSRVPLVQRSVIGGGELDGIDIDEAIA